MGYTIRIDQELCISSGKCVADAPAVFRFDDEELAEVVPGGSADDARLLAVARNCPGRAITLVGEGGNDVPLV